MRETLAGEDAKEGIGGVKTETRQWWHYMPETYDPTPTQSVTVWPSEPVRTGLLDSDGNPIMRNQERIGFLRDEK